VVPGGGYVNLVGAINDGRLTAPNATTFNFIGKADGQEHDRILNISDPNAEIAAGQTVTVQDGMVYIDTSSNTSFLKGTLQIGPGGALVNYSTAAESVDTAWDTPLDATGGTLAFQDRSLFYLKPGAEGIFENINLTTSGTPIVVVGGYERARSGVSGQNDGGDAVHNLSAATTPNMLKLLKASNLWVVADYDSSVTVFGGDGVTIGDGRWVQSSRGYTRDSRVGGTIRAEPGTTIGFASMGVERNRVFYVQADIQAAGATVCFNTTEPLEIDAYWASNPAGNGFRNIRDQLVPSARITVSGPVTAETVKVQNGTVTFARDLTVPARG